MYQCSVSIQKRTLKLVLSPLESKSSFSVFDLCQPFQCHCTVLWWYIETILGLFRVFQAWNTWLNVTPEGHVPSQLEIMLMSYKISLLFRQVCLVYLELIWNLYESELNYDYDLGGPQKAPPWIP